MVQPAEIPKSTADAADGVSLRVPLTIAAGAVLAWAGASTLWWPMGRDQGVFAWVGSVIARGGTPYADAWELKGPAAHLTYALAEWLFGVGMWGIRLLDLIVISAVAVAGHRTLARSGAGDGGALLGACLLMAWHWGNGYWDTAQPDSWAALLALSAIALMAWACEGDGTRSAAWPLVAAGVAGGLLGVGAMFKPLFAGFGVVLPILAWPERGATPGRRPWTLLAVAVGSMAAVAGAIVGWMAASGALTPFLTIQLDFNWAVHRASNPLAPVEHLRRAQEFASEPGRLLALPLAIAGGAWAWRRRRRLALALFALLAVGSGAVVLQGKYYPYHFGPVMVALAMLAGFGIAPFDRRDEGRPKLGATLAAAVVAVNLAGLVPGAWSWTTHVSGASTSAEYYARFGWEGDFSFEQCAYIAELVKRRTSPDDPVLVWAIDPLIYYLSQRMPPSRFGAHYPLTRGPDNPFQQAWREEFMRDVTERPPELIVIADRDENNLLTKASIDYIDEFPEFKAFVQNGYASEAGTGRFYVLRRKPGFRP